MENTHTRLYQIPGGLFLEGAPIYMEEGVLWQDNQTAGLFAQLKLKNIDPRTVQSVTVKLIPFDTVGALLGDGTVQVYAQEAAPNSSFGDGVLVAVPERSCAFGACVAKVCFADGSIWEPENLRAWHVAPEGYDPQAPVPKKKGLFGR